MVEEQEPLNAGDLVRGRYMIRSVLAPGSTGTVYLVKDQNKPALQAPLQVLKEIRVPDQQTRYRFIMHGASLRQLHYPTLPRVETLFNDDKRRCVYLVMDYVEGKRLSEIAWGDLTWAELRLWCEPLITTLSYMHGQEQPIFHGDLKPANLVRTTNDKVMFVDIGYVPQEVEASRSNPYRAPEQFAGILDARSDVYGCGALFYTLLTGTEPNDALTRQGRVNQHKTDSLVLAHKLSPAISREMADVLQRALALDPAERFPSVKAFWLAFEPLALAFERQQTSLRSEPESSTATGTTLPPPPQMYSATTERSVRRWLLPIVAAVAALLLLVAGAGAWAWSVARGHSMTNIAPGPSVASSVRSSTSTAGQNGIPTILGRYSGTYSSANASSGPQTFTIIISQQNQQNFSGKFISTQTNGTLTGVIDAAGDLHWTVVDTSGNAIFYFYGGLNGIGGTQNNTQDNMGGTFSTCVANKGPKCVLPTQGNDGSNGGPWQASFVSSAFLLQPLNRSA